MKRIILLACALTLLLAMPAAAGGALMEIDDQSYVRSILAAGDTLVLVGDEALYTWREGEEGLTAWTPDFRLGNDQSREEDGGWLYEMTFFEQDDSLRGARVLKDEDYEPRALQLFDVVFSEDGSVGGENAVELELPGAMLDEQWFVIRKAVCREGKLYLLCDADNGDLLCVFDPENPRTARAEVLQGWGNGMTLSAEGVLLVAQNYEASGRSVSLCRVQEDAALDELCALSTDVESVAADPVTGAVYAAYEGRVCAVNPQTGETSEPVGALTLDARCAAVLPGGRCYAAVMDGGVAVLDTQARLDEDAVLTVCGNLWDDWTRRAVQRFSVEHPEVTPVVNYDTEDVLEAMMTQSADADIYVLDMQYNLAYEPLLDRGFMLPLDGSPVISALFERLYPAVKPYFSREGVPVALPIYAYGSSMGVSASLLERMGLSAEDVPDRWPDFLDFMEAELLPRLDLLGERDNFTYDDMTDIGFRFFLFQSILQDWTQVNQAAGRVADYEDPRLVSTLEKLDAMDFTAYGLREGGEDDGYGYGWSSEVNYLIQINREFTFEERYDMDGVPLALGFGDDLPGTFALNLHAAFINPYSPRAAAAISFLEALAEDLPATTLYALCPDLNEPVQRDNWEKSLAIYEDTLERWEESLENAEPSARQELEDRLDMLKRDYERYREREIWLIHEDQLARYRANGDRLSVALPSWFERDSSGEAWQLMEQYQSRLITAREFLSAVNKKARMMEMEQG